ncbi:MAG TPA: tetraacyldisaccharide 4'-kinase [Steroidobacteraceae bacterium]|nr:tetraacyldisaccharide 4'-kinase [Steroidobacteraceae bacterium]
MPQRLLARWYAPEAGPSLLTPLSWLYGVVVALRRAAYRRGWRSVQRVARPVVIVGNLTVGGTGKTPLTLWIAQQLQAQGLRVGILSRGYGRRGSATRAVRADDDWRAVGDEPLLLARRSACPTLVARDRVAGAQQLAAQGVQVILCDDGLQHLRLERDAALVVLDGERGLGNARLLPAGPLREPPGALAGADALIVNGAPRHPSLAALAAQGALLRMDLEAQQALPLAGTASARALAQFRGTPVHAVAGIGNPQRFFASLRAHGLTVLEHPFPDHHPLTRAELDFADELPVLMTEKDAVKCPHGADARLWYVPVTARFADADARRLLEVLRTRLRHAGVEC